MADLRRFFMNSQPRATSNVKIEGGPVDSMERKWVADYSAAFPDEVKSDIEFYRAMGFFRGAGAKEADANRLALFVSTVRCSGTLIY